MGASEGFAWGHFASAGGLARCSRATEGPEMKTSPWRRFAAGCIVAAGCGLIFLFLRTVLTEKNAANKDFIAYWCAGQQLLHGADPYDIRTIQQMEQALGLEGGRPLIMRNPPFALFLTLPLGLVTAETGLEIWILVELGALSVCLWMIWVLDGRPDNRLHLFGYLFAPTVTCQLAGQFGIFLLLGLLLFLTLYKTKPLLGGAALLLCAGKPHLFVPFGICLLLWMVSTRSYRILAGFGAALVASCALAFSFDPHAWQQYSESMRAAGIMREFVPTLSECFRLLVHRESTWLLFVPEAAGCIWAVGYFFRQRTGWDWMDQGMLVLLVSVLCSPYSSFPDEAVLLPAVAAGVYRATKSGRSIFPIVLLGGAALIEALNLVKISSPYYLWTTPAWLGWYLYATGRWFRRRARIGVLQTTEG
jgi:hypothetical protein